VNRSQKILYFVGDHFPLASREEISPSTHNSESWHILLRVGDTLTQRTPFYSANFLNAFTA